MCSDILEITGSSPKQRDDALPDAQLLSTELWLMIVERLSISDLKAVSLANHRLHDACMRILYHTIDLSLQDGEALWSYTPEYAKFRAQQYLFAKQILERPDYGTLVKRFVWTLTPPEPGFPWALAMPDGVIPEGSKWTSETIVAMFARLKEAIHVDIDTQGGHMLRSVPVPPLFPKARHVRLGGKMHYELASAILHGPGKSPLESLILNNVQEGGRMAAGTRYRYIVNPPPDHMPKRFDPTVLSELWPKDALPIQVWPGGMRRLLSPPLYYRCRNLRFLALYKQGEQVADQKIPYFAHDEEIYHEWATFISAVCPSNILLAHKGTGGKGHDREDKKENELEFGEVDLRPMDERFCRIILPTLRKGLPGLSRLDIRGVSKAAFTEISFQQDVDINIDEHVEQVTNGIIGESR